MSVNDPTGMVQQQARKMEAGREAAEPASRRWAVHPRGNGPGFAVSARRFQQPHVPFHSHADLHDAGLVQVRTRIKQTSCTRV